MVCLLNVWVCAHVNQSLWLCQTNSVWEWSISAATVNTRCFLSDKQHVPFSSVYLDFYSSPSCRVNLSIFHFLCLSPCLSLPTTPPPTTTTHTPTCLLYCSVLWLDESSSRTTLTLSELVIPLAISTRPGWEKKGGQGAFPSVPYPLRAWLRKLGPGRLAACLDRTGWSRTSLFGLKAFRD